MLSLYAEDVKKHSSGSPCYIHDMCFYVARIGTKESNLQFKEISEKLYGLFPKPSEIDQNEIFANWLADCGVITWFDVVDNETDEPMEYTKAMCRQLFLSKQYWLSLNQALIRHATDFENYLHDAAYEDIETGKKQSCGSTTSKMSEPL